MPRLISTSSSVAATSTPSSPTNDTPSAVALTVVNSRAVSVLPSGSRSVINATPKSTPLSARPMRSSLPPLMPANASSPLPPMVSRSASICVGAWAFSGSSDTTPSLSTKAASRRSTASCPRTWKKPKASTVSRPAARVSSPAAPSIVISMSLSLFRPVRTVSAVKRSLSSSPGSLSPKSTTASSSLSARLISTSRSCPRISSPSTPTSAALSARACSAVQPRVSSVTSLNSASAKSTPPSCSPSASSVPPPVPTKASTSWPPSVNTCASVVLPPASAISCTWLALSSANSPLTCRKPKASMSRWPATCSNCPRAPSMSSVIVDAGPVRTASIVLRASASSNSSAVSA